MLDRDAHSGVAIDGRYPHRDGLVFDVGQELAVAERGVPVGGLRDLNDVVLPLDRARASPSALVVSITVAPVVVANIFAAIGAKTGAKMHTHPLSEAGYALVSLFSSGFRLRHVNPPAWSANVGVSSSRSTSTQSVDQATALGGDTDAASNVPPSFVCRYLIRAA